MKVKTFRKLACLIACFTMLIGSMLTVSAEEVPETPSHIYEYADGTYFRRTDPVPAVGTNGLPVFVRRPNGGEVDAVQEVSALSPVNGVYLYGSWRMYRPEQVAMLDAAIDAAGITNEMSQYDKCVAINNYVCAALYYNLECYTPDATEDTCPMGDGLDALRLGFGVCHDYADLFQTMCQRVGITCDIVEGDITKKSGEVQAHEWNQVFIDEKMYYVDPTWNDTSTPANDYLMSETGWTNHEIHDTEFQSETKALIAEMDMLFNAQYWQ